MTRIAKKIRSEGLEWTTSGSDWNCCIQMRTGSPLKIKLLSFEVGLSV
ncbi:MAG: hypothetical protein IPO07_25655 [Haliscomenobacter sp.]|nr:hypothetical protein [Haliscomenobacter sp.]MBK9491802.1 hypothetical protein [Haliscomenobacter sp.]